MKHAQVVNTGDIPLSFDSGMDSVLVFEGSSVINDTDQLPLGEAPHSVATIAVDIAFFDLMTGAVSPVSVTNITMTYQSAVKYWTVSIYDVKAALIDRHKYVGLVTENSGSSEDMREFTINEFAVDNDSFEASWMRQPYQIEIGGGEAWMVWYTPGNLGVGGEETYKAPAYEGGTGTTYATDPAKVTHRGAIVPYS